MKKLIVSFVLAALFLSTASVGIATVFAASPQGKIVVLDPGHGGTEPGAVSPSGLIEADVVYDIALRTKALLEAQGMTVYLTRGEGDNPSRRDRAKFANSCNADLMVGIHLNGSTNQTVDYTWGSYFKRIDYPFAQKVQNSLVKKLGRPDNGIHKTAYRILMSTNMPATQTEPLFITNSKNDTLLQNTSDTGLRQDIAQGITNGILDYLDSVNSIPKTR